MGKHVSEEWPFKCVKGHGSCQGDLQTAPQLCTYFSSSVLCVPAPVPREAEALETLFSRPGDIPKGPTASQWNRSAQKANGPAQERAFRA
jgi:hypothetical protein